ncbi:MAG: hypothetical protein ACOX4U_08450 [Anaerovoracaceae bacterium]|jgi:hypothetical protein
MYDTAERVRRVRMRAGQLHRKRENRFIGGLASLCSMLALFLIGAVCAMTDGAQGGVVSSLCGAMLLYENAGGYVLAGVLSFAAAVVITVLCIRYRAKMEKRN